MKGLLIRWRPNQEEDAHEFLLGMFEHIKDKALNTYLQFIVTIKRTECSMHKSYD